MHISVLDSLSRQISMVAITGYQKHISPHKGFICAHRVLHGGESCSEYIKSVIAKEGLRTAVVKSRVRFQACKQANAILRAHIENTEPTQQDIRDKKRKRHHGSCTSNNNNYQDCVDMSCECPHAFGEIGEIASHCLNPDCGMSDCSFHHCSGADCGALDCSGADCSSLDCSSLDCGSCGS